MSPDHAKAVHAADQENARVREERANSPDGMTTSEQAMSRSARDTLDRYLGDGVYASFDGYHVIIDTRAQDPLNRIALEPEVLAALNRYAGEVAAIAVERRKASD